MGESYLVAYRSIDGCTRHGEGDGTNSGPELVVDDGAELEQARRERVGEAFAFFEADRFEVGR